MARQLVQSLTDEFDPSQFKDEYHKALRSLAKRKIEGEEIVVPERHAEPEAAEDLMEALRRSVEAVREGGGRKTAPRRSSRTKRKAS